MMEIFTFETAKARLVDYFAVANDDPLAFWMLMAGGPLESKVAAWRQVGDAGLLPRSAVAFLIAAAVESTAEALARDDARARALQAQLDVLEAEAGVDHRDEAAAEQWIEHMAPPAYRACWEELERIEHRYTVETFRKVGESNMAELYDARSDAYDRLREQGRRFFLPPLPPQ